MRLVQKYLNENPIVLEMYGDKRGSMKVLPRSDYVARDACELCGRKLTAKSHTDHDHGTGLIRGELHAAYNVHLGHWEKSQNWLFNKRSGVTLNKVMGYLMRAELQETRFMYESRLSIARRCWQVAKNASSTEEARADAIEQGLPWMWVQVLAVQHEVQWA